MADGLRVARPPERPLAIFDGDCGFCRLWIARWKLRTGPKVDYAPSQEVAPRFPEISAERFARAFQLVLPDGRVLEGAEAVLALAGRVPGAGTAARPLPARPRRGAAPGARVPARRAPSLRRDGGDAPAVGSARSSRRRTTSRTPSSCGSSVSATSPRSCRCGSRSTASSARAASCRSRSSSTGCGRRRAPAASGSCRRSAGSPRATPRCTSSAPPASRSRCSSSRASLPAWSALAAWGLYLSLSIAGQHFLEFQWDILLTEAGLLAVFLAPPALRLRRRSARVAAPRPFPPRLAALPADVLVGGRQARQRTTPTWRSLTALRVHYETQPLPPWTAWFVHQLPLCVPDGLVRRSVLRRARGAVPLSSRRGGCGSSPARSRFCLQVLIASTGNYAFFNLLTIALAVLLVDDATLRRRAAARRGGAARDRSRWPRALLVPAAVLLLAASAAPVPRLDRTSLGDPGDRSSPRYSRARPAAERQRLRTLRA